MALLGIGGAVASLPFSRAQKPEVDQLGLVYMAKAGWDPREALAFWKRTLRASKGKEPPEPRATTRATSVGSSGSRNGCPRRTRLQAGSAERTLSAAQGGRA
jgi:predicted Zn-dependent protease